jgi:hypothetical protein
MRAEEKFLQQKLLTSQNADGGWGYGKVSSWTESTALALLALPTSSTACARASGWLRKAQNLDGGWPPQPSVGESTWVTSLALLATPGMELQSTACKAGLNWLILHAKPPSSTLERLLVRARGLPVPIEKGDGQSWFPHTAAWVYPTAIAILSLSRAAAITGHQPYQDLAQKGREYILSKRHQDGGWNHGGSSYLSTNAESYPEMTGLALLALTGVPRQELTPSLERAHHFLSAPASMEGLSWLQMGLMAHGYEFPYQPTNLQCRTVRDVALRLLALMAAEGRNTLLISH